jgi:maltooligosyltrehalose trehalohydrolase
MPFGAEVRAGTGVRFSLWAPEARQVELCLEDRDAAIPVERDEEGWASVTVAGAHPGTRYAYRIDRGLAMPDPASRFQPEDVHGPSEVIDPDSFDWTDGAWRGRPWHEMVFYELHVGTFTLEGTFAGVQSRLDHLADLGVTAVELMPVADFPGRRNWGYDGVLPFAPDSRYGRPEDLKALVQACHDRGLAVFLDVVYNHFGPEGNYLGVYAPHFFSLRHHTPWGDAINFDAPGSQVVRAFFRDNALFWLEEYHLDGLRLDAVHAIWDDSPVHILEEIGRAVQEGPGRSRRVHLVLENDRNESRYLRLRAGGRPLYAAQWNDDIHHALHVLCTGERGGYYADYPDPVGALARCLTEGFAYQGEHSPHRGSPRGEPSRDVPPTAFVSFLQNHDQIGNRAFGERLSALAPAAAVRAATSLLLLAPSPPMLFMGEEWAAAEPFLFFCDFGDDLGPRVVEGRRAEFARFPEFADPERREQIPSPEDEATYRRCVLRWEVLAQPPHHERSEWIRGLLDLRRREIVPRLEHARPGQARCERLGENGLVVEWALAGGARLRLVANLGSRPLPVASPSGHPGRCLIESEPVGAASSGLPPWYVAYHLVESTPSHRDAILDQFTRQAGPFSTAAGIKDEQALRLLVEFAGAGPDDTVLDVACGGGLVVCAFARVARHATGIDLTPAMIARARALQQERGLTNVTWRLGDVVPLPFADGSFSIVTSRFAFHHFLDPGAVLAEMKRVCRPGGTVAVVDTDASADPVKAREFNRMEKLRDPSHVRAMPRAELIELFARAGLSEPRATAYRLESDLESLLGRSFPLPGDADKIRQIFAGSLENDRLGIPLEREGDTIHYAYPVAVLASTV